MTEAELLFTEVLNCGRMFLYMNKGLKFDRNKSLCVSAALKRRIAAEPLAYILGKAEFMGLEFKVTPDVLIPRQETEILVEAAMDIARSLKDERRRTRDEGRRMKDESLSILDIGTGSGCIAISFAKFISNIKITATDISDSALNIAKYNARSNNIYDRIEFIKSDLFFASSIVLHPSSFDLIISNPPYIPSEEIKNLQAEVRHEPRIALDGGGDGLDFYRRIIGESSNYLRRGGFLVMEMGFGQREKIENIFQKYKNFEIIEVVKDYCGIERVIVAQQLTKYG